MHAEEPFLARRHASALRRMDEYSTLGRISEPDLGRMAKPAKFRRDAAGRLISRLDAFAASSGNETMPPSLHYMLQPHWPI